MKKDVTIFPNPDQCLKCKRKMNCHSRWSIRWHKFIYRHFPGYLIKEMDVSISIDPDGSVNYELSGGKIVWPTS